jgi:hypothetical protein
VKTFTFIDARTLFAQSAAQFDSSQAAVKDKSRSSSKCPKLVGPADMTDAYKTGVFTTSWIRARTISERKRWRCSQLIKFSLVLKAKILWILIYLWITKQTNLYLLLWQGPVKFCSLNPTVYCHTGDHLEVPAIDGRVNGSERSGMVWHGLDWSGSGYEQVAGTCKCGNEPSGSIKFRDFLISWGNVSYSGRTLLYGFS